MLIKVKAFLLYRKGEIALEDTRIVELYLNREESAIGETAKKYGARLRALSFGIVGDKETAKECENDTYMEAWNRIPPHEPRTYLYAFLARIVRHISLNRCRADKRLKRHAVICELSAELEQCIPAPDDTECRLDDMAFRELINGFLGTLSEEKRNVFLRRYWYMDSVAELSKRFSISESKVKVMLYRCREAFRTYLEKEGYTL